MRVTNLYLYPIKSGPAVAVEHAATQERGFENDRRFMVTSPAGKFMTQRSHPALGRCRVELEGDTLRVHAPEVGAFACPLEPRGGEALGVRVWSADVAARLVSSDADAFFSTLLGEPARLVHMPEDERRPVGGFEEVAVSFADGFPYLVTNTASLVDLNERIEGPPLPMLAFRPNIVVQADTPWDEDHWNALSIGGVGVRCVSNCERCSVTTLDPMRPDRPRPDGEPLRTLAKFRRNADGKVDFGRNALADVGQTIRVGDPVSVA